MTDTRTHARQEKKLSVVPKGHWRNKWRHAHQPNGLTQGWGTWPSAEIAEQKAAEFRARPESQIWFYLGAEFFPSDDP